MRRSPGAIWARLPRHVVLTRGPGVAAVAARAGEEGPGAGPPLGPPLGAARHGWRCLRQDVHGQLLADEPGQGPAAGTQATITAGGVAACAVSTARHQAHPLAVRAAHTAAVASARCTHPGCSDHKTQRGPAMRSLTGPGHRLARAWQAAHADMHDTSRASNSTKSSVACMAPSPSACARCKTTSASPSTNPTQ
jgi:hypothetical protein